MSDTTATEPEQPKMETEITDQDTPMAVEKTTHGEDSSAKVLSDPNPSVKSEDQSETKMELEESKSPEDAPNAAASNRDPDIDMYAYTKDGQFTSEIFKIEIFNLPNFVGFGQLKKRILSLELKPVKVKMVGQKGCAFVTFRCDEDRDAALEKCNGHVWKGKTWKAKKALPAADPLFRKRKYEAEDGNQHKNKAAKEEDPNIPPAERLNLAVTPLYKQPYSNQLESKEIEIRAYIKKLGREIEKNNNTLKQHIINQKRQNQGMCCPMDPIKPSPEQNNYRNKCEFTIGSSPDGKEKTVGFRFGRYSKGITSVLEVDECVHVPDAMKKLTKVVQTYIQEHSIYPGYVPEDKSGNWRQASVRTNCRGDIMLLLVFHPHKLTEVEVNAEREKVKAYFETGDGSKCGITSMYFTVRTDRIADPTKDEHLFGDQYIEEDLLDLKFRISPSAFFQINTKAAEVLYSTVADWCCVSDKTVLLDVCCGTGTIGITMAKRVQRVVGVELCAEAVEDAKYNATLNGLTNTEFVCSKAEQFMPGFVRGLYGAPAVAVVDPPRGGLHPDVVKAIRKCLAIKRVVYVSCNPNGALQNIVDFTRTESNRIKGKPFLLTRCVAVDMFPHAQHCELIMLLDREDKETKVDQGEKEKEVDQEEKEKEVDLEKEKGVGLEKEKGVDLEKEKGVGLEKEKEVDQEEEKEVGQEEEKEVGQEEEKEAGQEKEKGVVKEEKETKVEK